LAATPIGRKSANLGKGPAFWPDRRLAAFGKGDRVPIDTVNTELDACGLRTSLRGDAEAAVPVSIQRAPLNSACQTISGSGNTLKRLPAQTTLLLVAYQRFSTSVSGIPYLKL
jgi:hypothetical protein